jgi:NADH dehydrogenase FAD-containing subunit
MSVRSTRILVLGGGFGGVYAALHLERALRGRADVDITLVSRENFFLFTPMLHEVAASDLDITHIVSPLRTLLKRTTIFIGDVSSIDVDGRRVRVGHGFEPHEHDLRYDHLVVPDTRTGGTHPPTAQHALREARTVANNLAAVIKRRPARPFSFRTVGQLAAIGRRTGVARVFGVNFSGFVAWWLWRTIYLSKLPRFEKKCRVAIDWTLDRLFTKDFVQFLTVRAPVMSMREESTAKASREQVERGLQPREREVMR